jgi:hypothetical protein
MTSARHLQSIVCPHAEVSPAAHACCTALADPPKPNLRGQIVETAQLRRVYERRLANMRVDSQSVIGADRLLIDLAAYQGGKMMMIVWEQKGRVYCVFLDELSKQLVACTVAHDRRVVSPSNAD